MSEESKTFVLVAEDSAPNRNILVHLLKRLGFNVKEAPDGEAAWLALQEAQKNGEVISAVISDIMMPKMSGIQLLEKVRQDPHYKDTKFTLVTAVAEKDYIVQAKALNVNGYLLKPVSYEKIVKKMSEFFPDRKFPKLAA